VSSRILVLEDDESLRLVITKALSRAGYEVRATASPDTAIDRFLAREADVLVADVLLGQESFLDRLKAVRSARPDGPVILVLPAHDEVATVASIVRRAPARVSGRIVHVIVVDDIFDEGVTLDYVREQCQRAGAARVSALALVEKRHDRARGRPPEFIGVAVPDRYVFGCGMDLAHHWRHLPGIYALREGD